MRKIVFSIALLAMAFVTDVDAGMTKSQVESGIQRSNSYIAAHKWHEAFENLRNVDASIGGGSPELHYLVAKQRYMMYGRINKSAEVEANLSNMERLAMRSGDNATIEDMLLVKASYYNRKGDQQIGKECYKTIFNRRAKGKDDTGIEECFKSTISEAKKRHNGAMAATIQQMYDVWQDSIAADRSASELRKTKQKLSEAQRVIDDQEGSISGQWATIVFLVVLAIALAVALAFFILIKIGNSRKIHKLRKSLDIANKSNEQKSVFIRNISGQISPSLEQIAQGNSKDHVPALRRMLEHAEQYMTLESTREEKYESESYNVASLCDEIVKAANDGHTSITSDTTAMQMTLNKETVTDIVCAIIHESAKMGGLEAVTLSFKKRNPHTGQFVITALGMKLSEEDKEQLFTPFSKIYDLTITDGLVFPICSLMAYKMGGSLFLDDSFAKGTRFVLEVHC